MKRIILFFLLISCHYNNLNDEENYFLIRVDSVDHVISSKVYLNKWNTERKIVILYSYGDGRISAKTFFKGGLFDGLNEHFYVNGSILDSGFYKNGVKDGIQKQFYKNGKIKKTELYMNGKLISVETFDISGVKN